MRAATKKAWGLWGGNDPPRNRQGNGREAWGVPWDSQKALWPSWGVGGETVQVQPIPGHDIHKRPDRAGQ